MVKKVKRILSYPAIAAIAFLAALNYVLFVFPNKFAPAGIDGICTMIQDALHVNIGYLSPCQHTSSDCGFYRFKP